MPDRIIPEGEENPEKRTPTQVLSDYRQKAKIEKAKRELSRRHLLPFTKYNFFEYQENWHHILIADALEAVERGDIVKLMIFMPPRHGKSELTTVQFPAWYLGRNPRKSIISVSYSADLAKDFGRKVRNIVSGQEYINVFPEMKLSMQSKAADKWWTKVGGGYTATGIGGSITGKGAHVLLIDDPVKSRKEADSALIREQAYNWYRGTAYTRLAPNGAIVLIMTRWHDDDLAGRLLNDARGSYWHVINLPAIAKEDEIFSDFGRVFTRKAGEALWPAKFPVEKLKTIQESVGPYEWSAQYQGNPIDEASIEFHKEWLKERNEEEVQKLNTLRYLTVDTAGKMKEGSDYIGIVDNRVDTEGNWNLIARKFKMDPGFFADYLFILQGKYHYETIGIEKSIFYDGLEPYISKKELETGIVLPIFELRHKGQSKNLRIRGLVPFYKAGKIYHIEGKCEDLTNQLLRFPKGVEDDVVDAAAYQLQIAKAPFGWLNSEFPERDPEKALEKRQRVDTGFDQHSPIGTLDI